jgi:hypothetical protein
VKEKKERRGRKSKRKDEGLERNIPMITFWSAINWIKIKRSNKGR